MRTCVACRTTAPRDALVRVVASEEAGPVVDVRAVLPGRGAWVHPTPSCADKAVRRGGLAKGLRTQVPASAFQDLIAELSPVAAGARASEGHS
jgi:predicted RNA-binding protein YlxR (DUF448 family)